MPFQIALSGLSAASADLKTTGNNVANAGTTGFKSSRAEFVDVFSVGYGGSSGTAIGGGTRLAKISQSFSQGNLDYTNNNLDLAVNGQGFFVLSDNGADLYSRAGAFSLDREGNVTNSSGHRLQAFSARADGTFDTGTYNDLRLSASEGTPQATDVGGAIEFALNLDASSDVPALPWVAGAFPPDPDTYTSSTSLTTYDSLGRANTLTTYYAKSAAPNEWSVYTSVTDHLGAVSEVRASAPAVQADGGFLLQFGTDGTLVAPAAPPEMPMDGVLFSPVGADPVTFVLDYSDATQYGSPFAINSLTQYGFSTGELSGVDIDAEGIVSARYTNGQSSVLGKVALANATNPQGMQSQGDSVWAETFSAGMQPAGEAGTSNFGLIQSGALEASNVDVGEQLVNLITAQRNFQANAQVISTADTVTQTIINIR